MTDTKKAYVLLESMDSAYKKFLELEADQRVPVNMQMIAREYAPKTFKQVVDAVVEHPEILALEAKAGYQVLDVMIATIGVAIATAISDRYIIALQQAQGTVERNKIAIARG